MWTGRWTRKIEKFTYFIIVKGIISFSFKDRCFIWSDKEIKFVQLLEAWNKNGMARGKRAGERGRRGWVKRDGEE